MHRETQWCALRAVFTGQATTVELSSQVSPQSSILTRHANIVVLHAHVEHNNAPKPPRGLTPLAKGGSCCITSPICPQILERVRHGCCGVTIGSPLLHSSSRRRSLFQNLVVPIPWLLGCWQGRLAVVAPLALYPCYVSHDALTALRQIVFRNTRPEMLRTDRCSNMAMARSRPYDICCTVAPCLQIDTGEMALYHVTPSHLTTHCPRFG